MSPLNILIVADPYIPVPPQTYGGIERVVDFLVRGLVSRGHQVTLAAHPASSTPARLVPYGCPPHTGRLNRLRELWQAAALVRAEQRSVDVVHSFGRLAALLPILPNRRLAKIQSYQRDAIPWSSVRTAIRLAGNSLQFTACAEHMFRSPVNGSRGFGQWHTVFNGVDLGKYHFRAEVGDDAPLVFLGRVEPIKGAHHAIAVARACRRRLVIAGNLVDTAEGRQHFHEQIAPFVDGNQIKYVGPVDDAQKDRLLGSAAALLMLIDWEEPFGIVMAEAMACGTPVIGLARGSVPEVVRDGLNGFVCRTLEDATQAAARLGFIDRSLVRKNCEQRFGHDVIVTRYETLYRRLLCRS